MLFRDRLPLNSKREYTPEGYLRVPARIARTGIYQYTAQELGLTDRDPEAVVNVYRPPEEVFNPSSMASFANKPITNDHPPELVTIDNYKKYSVGMSGDSVTVADDCLQTFLIITDSESIRNVESGKVEMSNGYVAELEWTNGVDPDGVNYEVIQRNIYGNHIAIVEQGRAGSTCRLADKSPKKAGDVNVMKVTIDGIDFEVSEQAAQAVGNLKARLSDAEEEAKKKDEEMKEKDEELEKKDEELEEKEKELKSKDEEVEKKVEDALKNPKNIKTLDALISSRLDLVGKALKLCPDLEWKGKDNLTIMREVIAEHCENIQLDSKNESYIEARFDTLVENFSDSSDSDLDEHFKQVAHKDRKSSKPKLSVSQDARAKFAERNRNAWKKSTGDSK